MKQCKTPELDKMLAVKEKSQAIGEFLKWLSEQSIVLAEFDNVCCEDCGYAAETLVYIGSNRGQILADYFDIDTNKCEQECQQLLADLRADRR